MNKSESGNPVEPIRFLETDWMERRARCTLTILDDLMDHLTWRPAEDPPPTQDGNYTITLAPGRQDGAGTLSAHLSDGTVPLYFRFEREPAFTRVYQKARASFSGDAKPGPALVTLVSDELNLERTGGKR